MRLISSLRNRINTLRNIETLLNRTDFLEIYEYCTDENREAIDKLVENEDLLGLKKALKNLKQFELETMSVAELRHIASDMYIKDYAHYPKDVLVCVIAAALKEKRNGRTN